MLFNPVYPQVSAELTRPPSPHPHPRCPLPHLSYFPRAPFAAVLGRVAVVYSFIFPAGMKAPEARFLSTCSSLNLPPDSGQLFRTLEEGKTQALQEAAWMRATQGPLTVCRRLGGDHGGTSPWCARCLRPTRPISAGSVTAPALQGRGHHPAPVHHAEPGRETGV